MKKQLNIGLLWHSDNNGNLGVGALTVGNMALARQAAERVGIDPVFHLLKAGDAGPSYIPEGITNRHDLTGRYTFHPSGYWSDIKKLDVVLDIAAGDSFADIYPTKRFIYQAATKYMAIKAKVPLVLSPQTIGPFTRQPHTSVAAWLLKNAHAVFARDPMSYDAVRKLASKADLHQTIDVAFALPFNLRPKEPDLHFGIGISGLLYSGGYTGKDEFGLDINYRDFTHRLIEALLARGDTKVVLIKHVYAPHLPSDDDKTAARQLVERYPEVVDGPDFASPSEAKSYISGLDFLVAGRMHASIAAFSSGTPIIPFSYSRKFEGLFGSLDYKWLIPQNGMDIDTALAFTLDAYERREELKADIATGNQKTKAMMETYVDELSGIFHTIAQTA